MLRLQIRNQSKRLEYLKFNRLLKPFYETFSMQNISFFYLNYLDILFQTTDVEVVPHERSDGKFFIIKDKSKTDFRVVCQAADSSYLQDWMKKLKEIC